MSCNNIVHSQFALNVHVVRMLPAVLVVAALHSRCGHYIFVLFLFFLFFSSPNPSGRRLDVYRTLAHDVVLVRISNAGLKCAARGSLERQDPKKSPKTGHLGTITQLCQAISSQLRHISTIGKNLLNNNISPIRPYNMVNFGPLAAEISSGVWGTQANFNRFCTLAALLHSTIVMGVSQTLRH